MTVSIVIPTYNRAATLVKTLSSIYRQVNMEDCELIVIDNGSTDKTAEVCNKFAQESIPLRYFYDAEPGLLTGRHLGLSVAKGEIICFLDDDVDLCPLWLNGVKDAFKDAEVQLATGPCLPKYEAYPPSWLNYLWQKLPQGRACTWLSLIDLGSKKLNISPLYVWGLNFCIRKTALLALGGFHPDCIPSHLQIFQGDGETGLTMKAHMLKYKAVYHPEIMLYHIISAERLTVKYFEQRAFYQGVCNSFTALKRQYSINHSINDPTAIPGILSTKFRALKNRVAGKARFVPKEVTDIMSILNQKEKEGYTCHQEAFKNNSKVKQWVLQADYWNYKLPV